MNTYVILKTPTGYMSEFNCSRCGKNIKVLDESETRLKLKMSNKKYCENCAKEMIRKSYHETNVKRKRIRITEDPISIKEFNEGYERFWKKRGYKPPAVNQYVLEKL